MSSVASQNSIRKTLGAIKDTTAVSLAKINSDYKDLDIAIVKATNHYERPAKERHIKAVFAAISSTQPRADVVYCIHALARRLSKTHNWAVALKTLIVIHRAMREVDPTFQEQIISYGRSRTHMLNLAHFKDDSSPNALEFSAWIRAYASFLEERMECFRVLKFDIRNDCIVRTKELDTPQLLEQIPTFQNLLYRVLGCQPQGAATNNFIIQFALSMVASESVKIYNAISDGATNLVDKFFEMQRLDALKALDIYRRAGLQAERLSKFYEVCKTLNFGRGQQYIQIEQPPASFIQTMEEYVRVAPHTSTACEDTADENPKTILAIEDEKSSEEKVECQPSTPSPESESETEPVNVELSDSEPEPDFLGLHEPTPLASELASELEEKNAVALAILPLGDTKQAGPTEPNMANGITNWELALVTSPSSNDAAAAASKLAGGMDKFTLDCLYEEAIRRTNHNASYNPWEQAPMSKSTDANDPFYASNAVVAPIPGEIVSPYNDQQRAFLPCQQMMVMGPQQPAGPFAYGQSLPVQAYNPYPGLI